jgi:hypothetical protein
MKIGNFEFNVDAMSNVTREEFIARYKGKLKADINYAADLLDRYFKKEEVVVEEVQVEKPKRRRKRK